MILKTLTTRNMSVKISVVMASFLGSYEFSAEDRVRKFHRAVDSFLKQTYLQKELIIVSDGCDLTVTETMKSYVNDSIKLVMINKQPLFSGNVRNKGLEAATGDIVSYLDTDDFLGINHLSKIAQGFEYHNNINNSIDWVYFDDHIIYGFNPTNYQILSKAKRDVKPECGTIGTSSIAHKRLNDITWGGCDGYGHDWTFIKRLIDSNKPHTQIHECEYYVCHIPTQVDC